MRLTGTQKIRTPSGEWRLGGICDFSLSRVYGKHEVMDDPEVTLQEQIFHNAVREHIVSADCVELSVFYVCVCRSACVTMPCL